MGGGRGRGRASASTILNTGWQKQIKIGSDLEREVGGKPEKLCSPCASHCGLEMQLVAESETASNGCARARLHHTRAFPHRLLGMLCECVWYTAVHVPTGMRVVPQTSAPKTSKLGTFVLVRSR